MTLLLWCTCWSTNRGERDDTSTIMFSLLPEKKAIVLAVCLASDGQ